jgi:tetratricopeptide (TPR) repeat protein
MRAIAPALAWLALASGAGIACADQEAAAPEPLRRAVSRLLDRGKAEDALAQLGARRDDPGFAALAGDAFAQRGRVQEAEAAFGRAAGAPGPDRWYARARLAELAARVGRLDDAARLAGEIDAGLDPDADLSPADWLAFGIASRILGTSEPARFKDALVAFDRAIAADSSWLEPQLRVGELFLEKYNAPDARAAFEGVLRRDGGNARALLGLARVAHFNGDPRAEQATRRALEAGAGYAPAHVLAGRLALDAEQPDTAAAHAARAIALDSTSIEAWGVAGATQMLADDSSGFARTEARVRGWHRAPAPFYATIADVLARHRRYEEARAIAARAVREAPHDPDALTALGINELRTGRIDSGRSRLDRAFERDPYHVWNKNTLDLLDALAGYRTIRTERFVFVAPPEQADLLALYLGPLLEQAYDTLAARYRHRPEPPIRVELFEKHADFSVRTVGLAGLHALGVSFGRVVAMDAPSARSAGELNWGSTAWHELAHTFTLGASDHRVPRWLSEGLSVLEERRARPGWGAQPTVMFLAAYKGGKLHPVSRLNDGFMRPDYPAQIGLSYYQASLVCEYIEATHGPPAIVAMLEGYRAGRSTPEVVRAALGIEPSELDRRFDAWVRRRFADGLAKVGGARDSVLDPGELGARLATGARLVRERRYDDAIETLDAVQRAFPEQGDQESAAWLLAQAHLGRGDSARALEHAGRAARLNDTHLDANRLEAALREAAGDRAGAIRALERVVFIDPYDPATHARLAELAATAGDHALAVRERRAVLALDPSDVADARYRLALAYRDAGDVVAARREVLRVLEQAPAFERAQALLLELRRTP